MSFEYRFQVLERHLDTFGHVNNATYLELFEEARWDFITKNGWGLKEVIERQMGPVLLELNLKFKREITNREWITVKSVACEMKNSIAMVMKQEMVKDNGDVATTLEITVGLMDLKRRKLIPPTDEWLKACGQEPHGN